MHEHRTKLSILDPQPKQQAIPCGNRSGMSTSIPLQSLARHIVCRRPSRKLYPGGVPSPSSPAAASLLRLLGSDLPAIIQPPLLISEEQRRFLFGDDPQPPP